MGDAMVHTNNNSNVNMVITTWDPGKKREVFVGKVRNGVFFRDVDSVIHCMRKLGDSYCLQEDVMTKLVNNNITTIVLSETDTGKVYESDISIWDRSGDFGHGKQRYTAKYRMKEI
jgi:hypothetical protein